MELAQLTPQESERNQPKHLFGLSEQLYGQIEADVSVRRQAARGGRCRLGLHVKTGGRGSEENNDVAA